MRAAMHDLGAERGRSVCPLQSPAFGESSLRVQRTVALRKGWQARFLGALRRIGDVAQAASFISAPLASIEARMESDPAFLEACKAAMGRCADRRGARAIRLAEARAKASRQRTSEGWDSFPSGAIISNSKRMNVSVTE